MFDAPAYASYIALCRELNLTKDRAEPGDIALIWLHHDDPPWVSAGGEWYSEQGFSAHGGHWRRDVLGKEGDGDIWLPRLDQWLTMLEEAGVLGVDLEKLGACYFATDHTPGTDREGYTRVGDTREEAAAHLWMAVTGRPAQATWSA